MVTCRCASSTLLIVAQDGLYLFVVSMGILPYKFVRESDQRRGCRFESPEGHRCGFLRHRIFFFFCARGNPSWAPGA